MLLSRGLNYGHFFGGVIFFGMPRVLSRGLNYKSVANRSPSRNAMSKTAKNYIILRHGCVTLANYIDLESVIYFL